jgi:PAS domain S-box-containing protein
MASGIDFADPDFLRRVKILNYFLLIFFILAPLVGLIYFYIGARRLFFVAAFSGLMMIPGIVILRKSKSLSLAGNYTVLILWIALLLISWNTGAINYQGIIRPTFILNAGLILLAILLNGYLSGTVWTIIVFLETGLLVYLYRSGYAFPNLIPMELEATYSMGSFLVCLMAILLFAFLFRREKDEALMREQEKSRALRESNRYIDDILERSPLPTFIIDRSHRVVQWNRACEELTGRRSEEMIGRGVWEGLRIDDRGSAADLLLESPDRIIEKLGDAVVSKTDSEWFEIEMPLEKIKGGIRTIITAAPILDNQGTVRGAIQTIQEIGPIQSPEMGLEDCRFETFPDPIFRINGKGRISFWNRACEENFGYSASQIIGRNPLTVVAKPYHPLFKKTVEQAFKGQDSVRQELRYQTEQGKPLYALAKIYPVFSPNKSDKECVVISTDITGFRIKIKKLERYAADRNEKFTSLFEEHELLRKNLATYLRKKDNQSVTN